MGAITLRGLEPSLKEKLKRAAKKQGKSVNQMVKDTLKQHLGLAKDKEFTLVHHDLDHLFGRWSEEEFKRIQRKIDSARAGAFFQGSAFQGGPWAADGF